VTGVTEEEELVWTGAAEGVAGPVGAVALDITGAGDLKEEAEGAGDAFSLDDEAEGAAGWTVSTLELLDATIGLAFSDVLVVDCAGGGVVVEGCTSGLDCGAVVGVGVVEEEVVLEVESDLELVVLLSKASWGIVAAGLNRYVVPSLMTVVTPSSSAAPPATGSSADTRAVGVGLVDMLSLELGRFRCPPSRLGRRFSEIDMASEVAAPGSKSVTGDMYTSSPGRVVK
jgi:hypothetical protein